MVGTTQGPIVHASGGIVVRRPQFEQLLAMKLGAWRDDVDIADARRLLEELSGSRDEIWARVAEHIQPGRELNRDMPSTISGRNGMARIEELAKAAISGNSLELRSLTQDFLNAHVSLERVPAPEGINNPIQLAAAAAIVELLAEQRKERPPSWTSTIGPSPVPVFLLKSALTMRRLRIVRENESPPPLRRRNFFAPPTYLESA